MGYDGPGAADYTDGAGNAVSPRCGMAASGRAARLLEGAEEDAIVHVALLLPVRTEVARAEAVGAGGDVGLHGWRSMSVASVLLAAAKSMADDSGSGRWFSAITSVSSGSAPLSVPLPSMVAAADYGRATAGHYDPNGDAARRIGRSA